MLNHWKLAVLVVFAGCAHGAPQGAAVHIGPRAHYEITISDNFDRAKVRACFEGFDLTHLSPVDSEAAQGMMVARSDRGALEVRADRIGLPAPESSACISYETRFVDEVFRTRDSRAVIVSQSVWLWRPEPFPSDLNASVSFSLPADTRVSVPSVGDGVDYQLDEDAFYRSGYNVFGEFAEERFSIGDTSVTVARLGPLPADAAVRQWLTRAIGAAASVGSELPVKRLHFVIVPVDGMDRPVAFGMVRRGGGVSVLLIPSTTAEVHELEADWVAIHELSHLWLPRVRGRDRWLTEGIATYLQEVLRARCGLQSAAVSWDRIRDGLERGRRSGTGRMLTSESRDMNRTGAYFRVYWAGTAFALEADLRLRRESRGEMTLLRALDLAQPRLSGNLADAEEVLTVLDEVSGSDFLAELGARYASSARFPTNRLLDAPADEGIRRQIMKPEPNDCVGSSAESSR